MVKMANILFWFLALLLLCGAARPLSLETYQRINQGLRPAQAMDDPDLYHGLLILAGGRVESLAEDAEGRVLLVIFPYALDAGDRPFMPEAGLAPFFLRIEDSADLALLQPGRLLTLACKVAGWYDAGREFGRAPLLVAQEIHPWLTRDEERALRPAPEVYWPHCCYDPWCAYPRRFYRSPCFW